MEAVLAQLDRRTLGLFADHEAAVIPSLVGLSVTDTARAMAHWKAQAAAVCVDPEAPEHQRSLHLSKTLGGSYALDGERGPASGRRCHDCGVEPGGHHHPGCDWEECPRCGGRLISCGCPFDKHEVEDDDDYE